MTRNRKLNAEIMICNDSMTKTPHSSNAGAGRALLSVQNLSSAQALFGTGALEMFIFVPKLYF